MQEIAALIMKAQSTTNQAVANAELGKAKSFKPPLRSTPVQNKAFPKGMMEPPRTADALQNIREDTEEGPIEESDDG